MARYASGTDVTADRSRSEIERLLMRFGADEFAYVTARDKAMIGFVYQKVRCEISIELPDKDLPEFTKTPARGTKRTADAAFEAWQKEVRRKWRALAIVVKAMLVGVEEGVFKFDEVFMPYIVMGDGVTIYRHCMPLIQHALETGAMPNSMRQLEALPEPAGGAS